MKAVQESDKKAAIAQRDRILARAKQLQRDWVDTYLDIRDFRDAVVNGHRKWELVGYEIWEEFVTEARQALGESRAEFQAKLTAVSVLPARTIRRLGKTKAFQAARLKKAGKLSERWQRRLERMNTDEARAAVQKVCSEVEEAKRRLVLLLPESQFRLWEEQQERFQKLTGASGHEALLDFLLGQLTSMTDEQIEAEHEGRQVQPVKTLPEGD